MDFGAIPIVSLTQAGLPSIASNIGSAAVGAIPWIEASLIAAAIMPFSGRKRSRSGGYGRMNYKAGAYYGKTAVGRSLSIKGTHSFKRTVNVQIPYAPSSGFNIGNASPGMSFAFSLASLKITTGAATIIAIPGAADLIGLFDKWRIAKVTVKIFFQNNSSSVATVATNMPLLNYVWDTSNDTVLALSDLLQYPSVRQYQFGNGAATSGCLMTGGSPRAHLTTGEQLVAGTTVGGRPETTGAWMDTTSAGIQYNALKVFVDGFGGTQTTTEGNFSVYVDIVYQCKDAL